MARFHMGEENNYGAQETTRAKTNYFSIRNDGEVKKVRFMYKSPEDVTGYAVHEVQLTGQNGKYKKYVNCLRDYNSPIDDCPFCKAGMMQQVKLYIPVYEVPHEENGVQVPGKISFWERGKKFFQRMSSICARYPDVVAHTFEIERHGAPGSTDTTYDIYETGSDGTTITDLPEIPKVLGNVILDKNANEMNEYLQTGSFPKNGQRQEQAQPTYNSPVPQRRVPLNNGSERF